MAADREGYALAAGLALGLTCLGKGRTAVGLSDLHLEDRLRSGFPTSNSKALHLKDAVKHILTWSRELCHGWRSGCGEL